MKRLLASILLAVALLTLGTLSLEGSLVGVAYADDGDGA